MQSCLSNSICPNETTPHLIPQHHMHMTAHTHLDVKHAHALHAATAARAAPAKQPYATLQALASHRNRHQQVPEIGPHNAAAAAHICRHLAEQQQQAQAEVLACALGCVLQPCGQEVQGVGEEACSAGGRCLAGQQLQR